MVEVESTEGHVPVLMVELREGGRVEGGVNNRVHLINVQFVQANEARVVADTPVTNAPWIVSSHSLICVDSTTHLSLTA